MDKEFSQATDEVCFLTWISGGVTEDKLTRTTILLDPSAKRWGGPGGWVPCNPWDRLVNPFKNPFLVPRSQLLYTPSFHQATNNSPVFVTQGHHDDDYDKILGFLFVQPFYQLPGYPWIALLPSYPSPSSLVYSNSFYLWHIC